MVHVFQSNRNNFDTILRFQVFQFNRNDFDTF